MSADISDVIRAFVQPRGERQCNRVLRLWFDALPIATPRLDTARVALRTLLEAELDVEVRASPTQGTTILKLFGTDHLPHVSGSWLDADECRVLSDTLSTSSLFLTRRVDRTSCQIFLAGFVSNIALQPPAQQRVETVTTLVHASLSAPPWSNASVRLIADNWRIASLGCGAEHAAAAVDEGIARAWGRDVLVRSPGTRVMPFV